MPLIGGTCSYLHMHLLVELHGQPVCGRGRWGYAAELMNSTTCGPLKPLDFPTFRRSER